MLLPCPVLPCLRKACNVTCWAVLGLPSSVWCAFDSCTLIFLLNFFTNNCIKNYLGSVVHVAQHLAQSWSHIGKTVSKTRKISLVIVDQSPLLLPSSLGLIAICPQYPVLILHSEATLTVPNVRHMAKFHPSTNWGWPKVDRNEATHGKISPINKTDPSAYLVPCCEIQQMKYKKQF